MPAARAAGSSNKKSAPLSAAPKAPAANNAAVKMLGNFFMVGPPQPKAPAVADAFGSLRHSSPGSTYDQYPLDLMGAVPINEDDIVDSAWDKISTGIAAVPCHRLRLLGLKTPLPQLQHCTSIPTHYA